MKKRLFVFLLIISILFAATVPALAADVATATPTSSSIFIDGGAADMFPVYTIGGNNYFKLRDLAYMLSDTSKKFEVEWDGANDAIILTSGEAYTVIGGEMTPKSGVYKSAAPTSSKIYLDGEEVQFTAYNIEDNNYFKLRDIGKAFDFGVEWDGTNNTVTIDTSKEYTSEPPQAQLLSYLSELFTEAYEPYYDGLHYAISNYEETILAGEYSATFFWTMYHLGNGLDVPSDLGKEQEANWSLQATTKITNEGLLDLDIIRVLADASAVGASDYSIPIEEFFPSIESGAVPK